MLIEYSIENFRSVRERQTLSMVAAPKLRKRENVIVPEIEGEKFPPLLKVAAIYGPNASGKSSLLAGLGLFSRLLRRRPSAEQKKIPVSPFRFDPELRDKPSLVEVHFIEGKKRFSYSLALTAERIVGETLVQYTRGEEELVYERKVSEGHETYRFENLEGGDELHTAWKRLTGPGVLFLSQAVANSSEELKQLRAPYNWLSQLVTVERGMEPLAEVSQRMIVDFPRFGKDVAKLLADIDIPVTQISSKLADGAVESEALVEATSAPPILRKNAKALLSQSQVSTKLMHKTAAGEAEFDFDEESDGTKNLIGFAVPWLLMRLENRAPDRLIVVDELDSSLHPKAVEALIRRHLTEPNSTSQLIFTTHDTHLMDTKLLRRDQIWITERDSAGATQLRSVHDFQGRESEDVEKRYYEGRYRGLPILRGAK